MSTIKSNGLNRYFVERVKPTTGCIRGYSDGSLEFEKYCKKCGFLSYDENCCIYEEVEVETAGEYNRYIQFICVSDGCNSIIQKLGQNYFGYIHSTLVCKNCGREYVYIGENKRKPGYHIFATKILDPQTAVGEDSK